MEPDSPFAYPRSSFQVPVDPPDVEPDSTPLETIQVNSTWLLLLRGCAKQLLQQTTWQTDDPDVLNLAQERAFALIGLLQDQGIEPMSFPIASMIQYAGSAAPDGWLFCDGSAVSRDTYADLFAVIGTTYGAGNGTTTFNLPDMRGRNVIGTGQGNGLANRELADIGGEETHVLSVNEMPAHNHTERYAASGTSNVGFALYQTSDSATTDGVNLNRGGGAAHNNMSPFLALNIIIKT